MTGLRPIIDAAVAAVIAEHPKYFTPKGIEHAKTVIVRKVMAAVRGDGGQDKPGDAASEPATVQSTLVEPESREGRAYANLRTIAGAVMAFKTGDGRIVVNPEAACEAVYAFGDLPEKSQWLFLTEQRHIGAWGEFFRDHLPGVPRRPILQQQGDKRGILMPWPWPPRKDGKVYDDEVAA